MNTSWPDEEPLESDDVDDGDDEILRCDGCNKTFLAGHLHAYDDNEQVCDACAKRHEVIAAGWAAIVAEPKSAPCPEAWAVVRAANAAAQVACDAAWAAAWNASRAAARAASGAAWEAVDAACAAADAACAAADAACAAADAAWAARASAPVSK